MNNAYLAEQAAKLNQERNYLKRFNLIYLAVAALALLCGYFYAPAGVLILAALFLFSFFRLTPLKKQFQQKAQTIRLSNCFSDVLEDPVYTAEKGISIDEIKAAGFIPSEEPEEIVIRDTTKGSFEGHPVVISDLVTNFRSVKGTKDDQKKDTVFLCGAWFDFTLPSSFNRELILWNKAVPLVNYTKDRYFSEYEIYQSKDTSIDLSVLSDAAEFDDHYVIFLKKGADPKEVSLPADFLTGLCEYTANVHGTPFVQIKEDHLRIFTRNRFMTVLQFSLKNEITPELLMHNDFQEIRVLLEIGRTLC